MTMLADQGFRLEMAAQSRTRIEGKGDFTKHLLRFRHNNYFGYDNQEVPELVLTNSHNGTVAYRFMSGIFRLVCSNGLVVQSADFESVKVRHSGGSDFEKRVIDASYEVIEDAPWSLKKIVAWKPVELTPPQRETFAAAALKDRDTTIDVKPSQVLAPRRSDGRAANLWTTANVVQENMIRGGLRGKSATTGRTARTRAVGSVGEDVRLNRALWTLTNRMAQLVGWGDRVTRGGGRTHPACVPTREIFLSSLETNIDLSSRLEFSLAVETSNARRTGDETMTACDMIRWLMADYGVMNGNHIVKFEGSVHMAGFAMGFVGVRPALSENLTADEAADSEAGWKSGREKAEARGFIPFSVNRRGRIEWIEELI